MTVAVKAKIVELIGSGEWKRQAVAKVGIAECTFYEYMRKDQEFRAAVEEAEGKFESKMLNIIVESAKKDPKWAAWMLERRFGDRWGKKEKVHLTSGNDVPFGFEE